MENVENEMEPGIIWGNEKNSNLSRRTGVSSHNSTGSYFEGVGDMMATGERGGHTVLLTAYIPS